MGGRHRTNGDRRRQTVWARYGFPIPIDYGATELGGVACWTMADHARFARDKRGGVGHVIAGAQIRIVEKETGEPVADDRIGIFEVRAEKKTAGGTPTTDIAQIDTDGFLYNRVPVDNAIIRGGFKVIAYKFVDSLPRTQSMKVIRAQALEIAKG